MVRIPARLSVLLAILLAVSFFLPVAAQEENGESISTEDAVSVDEDTVTMDEDMEEPATSVQPGAPAGPAALSESQVAAMVTPSVVQVRLGDFAGTGVKVAQGVLTASHLVARSGSIDIVASDGRRGSATVVRCDPVRDLALLQSSLNLPPLNFSPARSHAQGDPLLAFGYPTPDQLGGQATLTRGLISAIRQDEKETLLVQTDATMNPGNSGGPMVDLQGNLVAVAVFGVRDTTGLNFGVATESIQSFLDGPARQCPMPTPTAAATPTPGIGGALISDNFDDEARGLLPRSSTDPSRWGRGYVNGEYQLQKIDASWTGEPYASVPGEYGNAAIAVDAHLVGDAANRAVGVSCREDDQGSGYFVVIVPGSGSFTLARIDRGTAVELVTQRNSAIRAGIATNRIELSCAGDSISATVNGTTLATVRDTLHPGPGGMSFFFSSRTAGEARFDNLVITRR